MTKNCIAAILGFLCVWASPITAEASSGPFRFKDKQSWKMEQTMSYSMPGADGKAQKVSNKNTMAYQVVKLYPDGSALLEVSAAEGGSKSYQLATGAGQTYVVNAADPEMAAMMGDGAVDDLATLKSASSSGEWLQAESRSPIDWTKVPSVAPALGKDIEMEDPSEGGKWVVSRLKDETLGKVQCEVYAAKILKGSVPVAETVWFSRKEGFVVKKILTQGGTSPAEAVQLRVLDTKK